MPRGESVPITPAVLDWAIKTSGYSTDEVSGKIGISHKALQAWLSGHDQPTLTPLRSLAGLLKRPLAVFLLPQPPASVVQQVSFRHPLGEERNKLTPKELFNIREAARLQRGAAWILLELGDNPASLTKVSANGNHEQIAAEQRLRIGISVATQIEWDSYSEAFRAWRHALQENNVLVFTLPMGQSSVRGFSLWDDRAPLIAINTHWDYPARIFTLFHEFAHLITRTNSACKGHISTHLRHGEDALERWCERFAAAFLAPWRDVQASLVQNFEWRRGDEIEDLEVVGRLARSFRISLRAMVLRLIDNGVATWDLYKQIPPYVDQKRKGGGGGGRDRLQIRLDEYGERTADVFVRGLENDVLSRTDVLSYLDVADSDLDHLGARSNRK
jgi:Zn-dependent peptidase ImmA (M78 family)/transcriptional regulator with XRE-family HTH domain